MILGLGRTGWLRSRWELCAALGTLVGGFGVTCLAALIVDIPANLPSMRDYWSGTIGDLVFLPVVVYGVSRGVTLLSDGSRRSARGHSIAFGALGAAIGAATQISWIADPTPRVNWMLVAPHTFSPIGWYHAAFLTMTSGYLAGASAELFLRAREQRRSAPNSTDHLASVLGGNGAAIIATAGSLFVTTIVADSYTSRTTFSSVATMTAITAACALSLVLVFLLGSDSRLLLGPLAVAAATTAGVCGIAKAPPDARAITLVAVAGAGLAGISFGIDLFDEDSVLRARTVRLQLPASLSTVIVAWAWFPMRVGMWILILPLMNLLALILLDGWPFQWRQTAGWKSMTWAALVTSFVALTAALGVKLYDEERLRNVGVVLGVAFYALILGYAAERRIHDVWRPMMDAEVSTDSSVPGAPNQNLGRTATKAVAAAMALGVGGFLAFVPLLYESIGESLRFSGPGPDQIEWIIAGAATICGLTLGFPAMRALFGPPSSYSRDNPPSKPSLRWSLVLPSCVALFIMAASSLVLAVRVGWHDVISVVVMILALIMSVDCLEQTLVDSAVLSLRWPEAVDYLVGLGNAVVTFATFYWSLLDSAEVGGLGVAESLMVFIAGFAVRLTATLVAGGLIFGRGGRLSAIYFPVSWCQFQNELVRTTVALVSAWLPFYVLTHTSLSGAALWINVLGATSAVLFLATQIYVFTMGRLLDHAFEQRAIRFEGRFADPFAPSTDFRNMVPQAISLIGEFVQYLRSDSLRPDGPDEKGFIRAHGAHQAFSVLIRTSFVCATVIGLVVGIFSILQSPAEAPRTIMRDHGGGNP
jgi:hypothetical protein